MNNKWHVDQVIICINDTNCFPPIKNGLKYIINDIRLCPTCGMMEFKLSISFTGKQICVACKTDLEEQHLGFHWAEHWRFAPIEAAKNEAHNHNLNVKFEPKKVIEETTIISN